MTGQPMTSLNQFWHAIVGPHHEVSKDFEHMLMREVMRSELMRVRALIIVGLVILVSIWLVHVFDADVVQRIWHGINPAKIYFVLFAFISFEAWVYIAISRHLRLDRDIPVYRRYIGALIET